MDKTNPGRLSKDGEGALLWLAFVAVCMVAIAALITGVIRKGFDQTLPAAAASPHMAGDKPSPGPPPLPKPGVAPTGALLDMNA